MLLTAGEAIRGLPVAVLRPADMSEWARVRYDRAGATWSQLNDPEDGLTEDEQELWAHTRSLVPASTSRQLLVLGGGGGREAVVFGREGWRVTALDISSEMLSEAEAVGTARGISVKTLQGDLGSFDPPGETFGVIWTSMYLYSVVLGRERRLAMLQRMGRGLAPGGCLVVSYHFDSHLRVGARTDRLRRLVAVATLGNRAYQNGDFLFGTLEFRHAFSGADELHDEFCDAGFSAEHLVRPEGMNRGGAVLVKAACRSRAASRAS